MSASACTRHEWPDTWVLLRVLPGDTPPAIRLRKALKALLRGYRIEVMRINETGPPADRPAGK